VYHLAEQTSYLLKFLTVVDSTIQSSIPYFTIFGVTFAVAITNIHYGSVNFNDYINYLFIDFNFNQAYFLFIFINCYRAYATITMVGLEEGERLLEEPWSWRICVSFKRIKFV
jgi:hypothetical protein